MPSSSPTCGGAALAAEYGALSADHLEYLDEAGVARWRGRHGRDAPARRLLLHRETQKPPIEALREPACRSRSRPTAIPAPRR
jgi:imidazolonepropionase-like amidohydrolase